MARDTGWFKSSHSGSGNDTCVEVRIIGAHTVGVRDSKNPAANALWLGPAAWAEFVTNATR